MTPKHKANDLVDQHRMILMQEDTDCGNEIICTTIAISMAKIAVNEVIEVLKCSDKRIDIALLDRVYWFDVLIELDEM